MLYKISHDKVAVSKSDRLSPPLRHSRNMHSQSYQDPLCRTQQRKASFFPRTTVDWNRLPQTTGARCIRKREKKKKIYIILQESELTCFHFLSRRVKLSKWLVYAWESLYTDGKWSSQRLYDFGFSRRFVLVRVWCHISSEAKSNNWGIFGKENY
jgi:hypothetical protein